MSYYAGGSWGNNQFTPFGPPGSTGGFAGTQPVNRGAFQSSPVFGGGSAYYDTAGDGQVGYERFVQGMTGDSSMNGKFANWLRNRFNTVYNQYGAAQGQDPSLKWSDFLVNSQDKLQSDYLGQNQYDKGEQGQKQLKWL